MLFPVDTLGSLDNQTENKANTKKHAKNTFLPREKQSLDNSILWW